MDKKSKIIWGLFLSSILVVLIDAVFIIFDIVPPANFDKYKPYYPAVIVFSHMFYILGIKRGIFFVSLSSLTGLLFEIIGTKFGHLVGAGYVYNENIYDTIIFSVPLLIPIYWTVFIYTAYSITNSFLLWKNKNKPSHIAVLENKETEIQRYKAQVTRIQTNYKSKITNYKNYVWNLIIVSWRLFVSLYLVSWKFITNIPFFKKSIIKLILLDALVVLSIDLFMEPILVHFNHWLWQGSGFYYNIPTINFIGWFLVALIVSSIFRTFEYYSPIVQQKLHHSVYLIPLIGYVSLYSIFFVMAFKIQYLNLIRINTFIMLPIILLNLKFYIEYKRQI
jgi:uncharacterized membrane protein